MVPRCGASRRGRGRCSSARRTTRTTRTTQPPPNIDSAIGLNDYARVGRPGRDVMDMKTGGFGRSHRVRLVVNAGQLQAVKLDEIAFQVVVDGLQFRDVDF